MDNYNVVLTKKARKELYKVPKRIIRKFKVWVDGVEEEGLFVMRKIKSYHDEPLQGERFGQRSIRLSKSYRAFYVEKKDKKITLIEILEINKHAY